MDDTQDIIGLADLLSEVDRDLEDFRKKNPGDYAVKNIAMWWELERERVMVRHGPVTAVRRLRKARGARRAAGLFLAGWLFMLAVQVGLRLLVP